MLWINVYIFIFVLCFVETRVRELSPSASTSSSADGGLSFVRLHYSSIQHIYNGQLVRFDCRFAQRSGSKATVTWYKDGALFTPRKTKHRKRKLGKLTIRKLIYSDSATYKCVVRNARGSISRYFVLDVRVRLPFGPPIFKIIPDNITTFVGEEIVLKCDAISSESFSLIWYKKFQNGSHPYIEEVHEKYIRTENGILELVIKSATLNDTGEYYCRSSNIYGINIRISYVIVKAGSASLPLTVWDARTILKSGRWYIMAVCLVLPLLVIAAYLTSRSMRRNRLQKHDRLKTVDQNNPLYALLPTGQGLLLPIEDKWIIQRQNIELGEVLGEGAFGVVRKAKMIDIDYLSVAVKMLKENAQELDLQDLVEEIKTLVKIGRHRNVIGFMGACCNNGPLLVIMEYASEGNLRDYLKIRRPTPYSNSAVQTLNNRKLVDFSYQIACGMQYLAGKNIIHRDLACRNLLLSSNDDVKIADFGLTRHLVEQDYYRKNTDGRLPVKWMSPESLFDRKYTIQSDVWSFGIVLWEIFSYGGNPYPSVPMQSLFGLIRDGHRMDSPFNCPVEIYQVMLQCWKYEAKDRPNFALIKDKIIALDEIHSEYLDLTVYRDQSEDLPLLTAEHDTQGELTRAQRRSDSQYSSLDTFSQRSSVGSINIGSSPFLVGSSPFLVGSSSLA